MTNLEYDKIRYKNKYYGVICVKYKNLDLPVVVDWSDLQIIRNLNKTWKCNNMGVASCSHTHNGITKDVYLHEVVMTLKNKSQGLRKKNKPIIHINRIGLDNRRENILYDTCDKDMNRNSKKKKRTIELPANSGIKIDEVPTYVWYMKPDKTHGERFMVQIGDITWKTTSSKKLSLRYKLEEAKLYLRQLKQANPSLFEEYSMNGDYTKDGINLNNSYYVIIKRAGYDHLKKYEPQNLTDQILKPGSQSKKEKDFLRQQGTLILMGGKRRRVFNNLPDSLGISTMDLPEHCYYRPIYKDKEGKIIRGDFFVVEGHPNQDKNIWQTTTSLNVSTKDKYEQLLDYIDDLTSDNFIT